MGPSGKRGSHNYSPLAVVAYSSLPNAPPAATAAPAGREGRAPSGLELKRFVPRTMSDTGGVNPLEAWRDERCRARRYRERATRPATAAAGERASQSNESKRIRPMVCADESDADEAKSSRMGDDEEEEEECRSNPASINGFPVRERPKAKKAWKSGSMLVRPRADNGSERVTRTMYIYLVGTHKIDVELLVGPPGSQLSKVGEKNTVVRTMMSAGKHVCIPEHKTYLVRNMSDKRTAVLFWASPNETSAAASAAAEEKKKERREKEDVRSTLARFFPVPA